MTQSRRPSPLQRRVLIVLAALDEKRPGPVLARVGSLAYGNEPLYYRVR